MKTKDVIEKMSEIAERSIELYKSDFYKHDLKRIKVEDPREFAWMVRPTGTHMMVPPGNGEDPELWLHTYEVLRDSNRWLYHIKMNEDGSGEITLSTKKCDEFARRVLRKIA